MSSKEKQLLTYWAASCLVRSPGLFNDIEPLDKGRLTRSIKRLSRCNWQKLALSAVRLGVEYQQRKIQHKKEL